MGAFISKQPNGLYCRFSTVSDCPARWNMSREDYIEYCKGEAEEEAIKVLESRLQPFAEVKKQFKPYNMTRKEFARILREMGEVE